MASVTPDLWLPSQPQSTDTASLPVLISHPAESRRLSWPAWLVTYQDGTHLSTNRIRRRVCLSI